MTWNGLFIRQQINGSGPRVGTWNVGFCQTALAPQQSSSTTWAVDVKNRSQILNNLVGNVTGGTYSYFQSDTSLGDGWVVIWATSQDGNDGPPSTPLYATISATTGAIPSDPGGLSRTRHTQQVLLKDNTQKVYVFNHTISWTPPSDVSQFGGMSLFVRNINGDNALADMQEVSSMCPWNHTTGVQSQTYSFIMPEDLGVQDNIVTLTNGSTTMTRTSGTNFIVGNVGHQVVVYGASASDFVQVYQDQINTWTSTNVQDTGGTFTGTTGTYAIRTYNAMTYFLTSVSLVGNHKADPSTSTANFVI